MKLSRSINVGETPTQEIKTLIKWVGISPKEIENADTIEVWQNSQVIIVKVVRNQIVKITKRMEY